MQAAARNPDEIDAGFTSLELCDENVKTILANAGFEKDFVPIEGHMAFKYLVLVDGYVAAWHRNFWNFHANSVVFKKQSDLIIWFDRGVRENVHYVPIANDMADVADKVKEARAADDEMQTIVANAQAFAANDLADAAISAYLKELLTRYGELFRG